MGKGNKIFFFVIALLIFMTVRLIYFNPFSEIIGDQPMFAIMAKHILEGKSRPFFPYGQHYNGGSTVVAYTTAFFFAVLGISPFAYYLANLIYALAAITILYFFVCRHFGERAAFLSIILLTFSPVLFLNVTLFGDYMMAISFNLVILWLFLEAFYNKTKKTFLIFLAIGLISAIAWYNLEFVIPLLIILFLFWFFSDKFFFLTKNFFAFAGGFFVGFFPLLVYNLRNNFANFKQLLAGTFIHRFVCEHSLLPDKVQFGSKIVDHCKLFATEALKMPYPAKLQAAFGKGLAGVIFISLYFFALFYFLYKYRKVIVHFIKSFVNLKKRNSEVSRIPKIMIILVFTLFFLLLEYLSGYPGYGHLLPIMPFLFFFLAYFIDQLFKARKNIAAYLLLALILSAGVVQLVSSYPEQSGGKIYPLVDFLRDKDVHYLYSDYFTKWAIIFHTDEGIIVSCENFGPCLMRYPIYEEMVRGSAEGIVLKRNSPSNELLSDFLHERGILYSFHTLGDFNIYFLKNKAQARYLADFQSDFY